MSQGIWLAVIVFGIMLLMIFGNNFIKKITNYYLFWFLLAGFCLIWVIIFKFKGDWQIFALYASNHYLDNPAKFYEQSIIISKALLLDVCPFCTLSLLASLILDPSRKLARSIAPIAIIGGLLIVFGQMPIDPQAQLTFKFIFLGISPNECYFFFHAVNLLVGLGVMLNTPKGGWKSYFLSLFIAILYYGYVGIVMAITKCNWNVSGLSLADWAPTGQYHLVNEILKLPSLLMCCCLSLSVGFLVTSSFIFLKEFVFCRWIWSYSNQYYHWWAWYDHKKKSVI